MNRADAMLVALERAGFCGRVDHDLIRLDPPTGLACVALGADVDGYLVSVTLSGPAFDHRTVDSAAHRSARKALYSWSAELSRVCAHVWPDVVVYPIPDPQPIEPVVASPVYEYAYPLFAPIEDGFVHAWQGASREQRFVVLQQWQDLDGNAGPSITWHAWGRVTAELLGASKGWDALDSAEMPATHPAAGHVRRILCESAKSVEPPAGIEALDLRGLTLQTCEAIVQALIEAARCRLEHGEWCRGAILVCDPIVSLYLNRSVSLRIDA